MSDRTCSVEGCEAPHFARGMCKRCYRHDYYYRNGDQERARMKQWRHDNYEYDRQRWATYTEQRWGAEVRERAARKAAKLAAPDKQCSNCGENKPKTEFHKDPRRPDGRYSWCKKCFHKHVASMRTPEMEAARRRRYYENPENRAKRQAQSREWHKRHPDPEGNRQRAHKRRVLQLSVTVGEVNYVSILERDGMVCHLCGGEIASLDDLHFDHVIPLSRGGTHSMANIRPSHEAGNRWKYNKLMEELTGDPPCKAA